VLKNTSSGNLGKQDLARREARPTRIPNSDVQHFLVRNVHTKVVQKFQDCLVGDFRCEPSVLVVFEHFKNNYQFSEGSFLHSFSLSQLFLDELSEIETAGVEVRKRWRITVSGSTGKDDDILPPLF
jgi:hypothetical protein